MSERPTLDARQAAPAAAPPRTPGRAQLLVLLAASYPSVLGAVLTSD